MRIAQINFTRVNNALGGTEKVFFTMANELTNRGHSIACFYFDTSAGQPRFPIDERVYVKNCYSTISLKITKFLLHIRAWFISDRNKRRKVRRSVRNSYIIKNVLKFNPDIILLYWPDIIIYELNKLDIPTIQMIHMAPSHFETDNNVLASKEGLEQCDCIQVLMPKHVDELRKFIPNKNIVYIPNIVPQYTTQSDVTSHTIIFVGRIAEQKRPWLIIEAFALLKEEYSDWKIELWGEENAEPHITERVRLLIQKYDLKDRVIFCGTTLEVKDKLREASIMLMPSLHEGFCMALTEGMSMGLPAVTCKDCSTLNTLVRHGENGFLCEPTPEDIALQLSKLMDSYELRKRLGNQAREDMKQYRPDIVYDKWERLMADVIERRKRM